MYRFKPGIKSDPKRRWSLPDRIFFGNGACHILAGVYLELEPLPGFWAERIIPADGFSGSHIYTTNGITAFDYHGYSVRDRLLTPHWRGWGEQYPGWDAEVVKVDFSLLEEAELNKRKMHGSAQHYDDPTFRARRFIECIDHFVASQRAMALIDGAL